MITCKRENITERKNFFLISFLIICIGLVGPSMYAQDGQSVNSPLFNYYTLEDGLSHSTVHHIMKDDLGLMWISTREGVNRFDGYSFKVFKHEPADPNSLSHNTVWFTYQSRDGYYWMGTNGGGLNRYDPNKQEFVHLTQDSDDNSAISGDQVISIFEDSVGGIWIGTNGQGLNYITYQDTAFEVSNYTVDPRNPSSPLNIIMDIDSDPEGNLLLATYGEGIVKYDTNQEKIIGTYLDGEEVMSFEVSENNLWAGTKYDGLAQINLKTNEIYRFTNDSSDSEKVLSSNFVWPVLVDSKENVWAGTFGGGLNKLVKQNGTWVVDRYQHFPYRGSTISDNFISHIMEDRNSLLWVSTDNQGFFTYQTSPSFTLPNLYVQSTSRFIDSYQINDRLVDSNGTEWLGTSEGLLKIGVNRNADQIQLPSGVSAMINSLHHFDEDHLLIGTNVGLFIINIETRVISERQILHQGELVQLDRVFDFAGSPENKLWISTNNGVWEINSQFEVQRHITQSSPDYSISSNNTGRMLLDPPYLWIGTSTNGLNRLNIETGHVEQFFTSDKPETFGAQIVLDIYLGDHSDLWVATSGGGLIKLSDIHSDRQAFGYEQFTTDHGLPSNNTKDFIRDSLGTLWVTTQQGIAAYRPESNRFQQVSASVKRYNLGMNKIFQSDDGRFMILRNRGYLNFNPYLESHSTEKGKVILTGLEINGDLKYDSYRLNRTDNLNLNYKQNYLIFSFTYSDYTSPEQNEFQYRLEGLQDEWIKGGVYNRAVYTSLEPGTYRFAVKAKGPNGEFGRVKALSIIIDPPFWETKWFIFLVALTFLGMGYILYRYRIENILKVERTRQRIADDLHDDIGSKISSVALMLDMVSKAEGDQKESIVNVAKDEVRTVMRTLRDAIWLVDSENDDMQSFVYRMQQTAHRFFQQENLQLEVLSNVPSIRMDMKLRRTLFLMYKEVLNNICRHAEASKVSITISIDKRTLTVEIYDNGKGFDPQKVEWGRGLSTLERRAESDNIDFTIESREEEGTRILLKMEIA